MKKWRTEHPDERDPRRARVHPALAGHRQAESQGRRDKVIYYQYRADRARRTLRGIDEQVAKAEKAVAGKTPVKRNRFVKLAGGDKSVNRELEAKARGLAGLKGYITNIDNPTPEFVIGAYHQLWRIEKSFRMSKHDLHARPIYHHKRESIEAHLTIVFAALAVTRLIEDRTGWSIKKFVRTARRYRTVADPRRHSNSSPPRTRSPPTYATRSRSNQLTRRCALIWPSQVTWCWWQDVTLPTALSGFGE